jgi:hypothetical protein
MRVSLALLFRRRSESRIANEEPPIGELLENHLFFNSTITSPLLPVIPLLLSICPLDPPFSSQIYCCFMARFLIYSMLVPNARFRRPLLGYNGASIRFYFVTLVSRCVSCSSLFLCLVFCDPHVKGVKVPPTFCLQGTLVWMHFAGSLRPSTGPYPDSLCPVRR